MYATLVYENVNVNSEQIKQTNKADISLTNVVSKNNGVVLIKILI